LILACAFVPPEGKALTDTITGLFARIARRRAKKNVMAVTPAWMVRLGFLNGTTGAQRRFMEGKLYAFQRNGIDAIGGVQTLIEMKTCHMLMVSEPTRLAEILVERCRVYS
jgi:hypothetical protein